MALVVSAPGKVILFGDHSVVYNRQAIAASISLRTTLAFTPEHGTTLVLDFPDIGLHLVLSVNQLESLASRSILERVEPNKELDAETLASIDTVLDQHSIEGVQKAAASAFLYLFVFLGRRAGQDSLGKYQLRSELPIGAGLGSSASVSVIIATTLLLVSKVIEEPLVAHSHQTSAAALDLINKWAYVGEQCIHGTPSGVDNTVATYGRAVAFRKSCPIQLMQIPSLPLLLSNTGVPRSTKTMVANVASLRTALPTIVEPVLDAMHEVALEAQKLLPHALADVSRLGTLIELNQGLLRTLNVSHPAIEAIVSANTERGWTKLIGAGGGGCVITLLKETGEVGKEITAPGGTQEYRVSLGGPGVGVHSETGIEYYG